MIHREGEKISPLLNQGGEQGVFVQGRACLGLEVGLERERSARVSKALKTSQAPGLSLAPLDDFCYSDELH